MEPLRKNERYTVTIDGYTAEGAGVGRVEGQVLFVPDTIRGERCVVQVVKVQKTYAHAKLVEVLEPSPERTEPQCGASKQCGGCAFWHMSYQEELRQKGQRIHDALTRIAHVDCPVPTVTPSPQMTRYRNKAQFPTGYDGQGQVCFGFYRKRSHELVPLSDCLIQDARAVALAQAVCHWAEEYAVPPYDEKTGRGVLRHIYVRTADAGTQLCLVVRRDKLPGVEQLIAAARAACPDLCSIVSNKHTEQTNRVLGPHYRTLWGEGRLPVTVAGNAFLLSPASFFQVNHAQAEQIYARVVAWAAPEENTVAVDLYCGIGTMTLALARRCREVYGVEIVEQAVGDARTAARTAGLDNTTFLCADAGVAAAQLVAEGVRPHVVVCDPPRKGLDAATIAAMVQLEPARIVYVSCDCAALARDVGLLAEGGYRLMQVEGFDLFARTANVETVALFVKQG